MKLRNILAIGLAAMMSACALDEPELKIDDRDFPLRLQIDEEGADLADAEDYGIEISFADYIGELPSRPIILMYELEGDGDFAGVEIDEIIYEREEGDCVFWEGIDFDASTHTITIPVDPSLGTVPEAFEIVVAFNLPGDEAGDGGFSLKITSIQSQDNVVFSAANEFEYEILDNDAAGEWVVELDENSFVSFQEIFGPLSTEFAELNFSDITGEVKFGFEFEEMKIEIELVEEEEVTECENGETETSMENLVIEIETEYKAEDREIGFEGSYFNDGKELDFIIEAEYEFVGEDLVITFSKVVDEDHYEAGDELFSGHSSFTLIED